INLISQAISFIPFIGPIISFFIGIPLQQGPMIVALKEVKGRRWSFGDFFSGFNWFGPLVGYTLLVGLMILPCFIPLGIGVGLLIALSAGARGGPDPILIAALLGSTGLVSLAGAT